MCNIQSERKESFCASELICYDRYGMQCVKETNLIHEYELKIYLNGSLLITTVCSPRHLLELVYGRLLTEGIIRSADDVQNLDINISSGYAKVKLRQKPELIPEMDNHQKISVQWTPEQVFILADHFAKDLPLHRCTRSAHSCIILQGNDIIFEVEDIGRHNAIDKAIGWAQLQRIPLAEIFLFTSGRIPSDMALKAIRAGIPVMLSKETVTKEAQDLAQICGLTIIGDVRKNSFTVYTHPASPT